MPVFLSYILLLVCALILAGIGVLISFLGEKACLSRQCVGQAKFIHRNMDTDISPCDDFYSFVCNNFPQYGTSIIDEIQRKQLKRLVEYLRVPADWEEDDRIEHIAKSLYQNCKNDTQLEYEGLRPLQRILKRLGSIPFLDPLYDYEWAASFGVLDNELKHFFNGLNSIFIYNRIIRMKSNPSINPKNESEGEKKSKMFPSYSIPPHLYHETAPSPENYLQYCIEFNDLYRKSLLTNKTITANEMSEIKEAVKFKINLLKIIDKTKNCSQQPFVFEELEVMKTFGKHDGEDLQVYTHRKAQPGDMGAQDWAVKTPNFDKYIDELNELLKDVPDRVLATYMGVEALIQITPFLPLPYREIYDKYLKSEKDKNNKVIDDRKLLCAKIVKDSMPATLTSQYLKENPKPPEGVFVLNALTQELLMHVKMILRNVKWASKRDRTKMLSLVKNIKIVSPLPPDVMEQLQDNGRFEQYNLIMCSNEDSTLETYLGVKAVRMIRNAQILVDGTKLEYSVFHEDYDIFDTEIYFQEDSNSIVVPMAYLFYPSLDSLWPKYLSFGGLAVWIAHLILKTIGYNNVVHPGLQLSADPIFNQPWFDPETISLYENNRKCAFDEYNKYLSKFGIKSNDANCLENTLYYAAAMQAAYFAYKQNTKMRFFVEPRIPYFTKYTVDQIFFIKYASSFCQYEGQGVTRRLKDRDSAKVPNNFTLLYGLRNFPKFSEVFECEKSDKMTKVEPCSL